MGKHLEIIVRLRYVSLYKVWYSYLAYLKAEKVSKYMKGNYRVN